MKKLVFVVLMLLSAAPWFVHAQTVAGDSLIVHFKNGQSVAIALADIQKITFDSTSDAVQSASSSVDGFELSPAFPNPSHSGTIIEFSIPNAGKANIALYDSKGNLIRNIALPDCLAGENRIHWDGLDERGVPLPTGAYFYEVRFGNQVQMKQMVIIR